MHLFDFREKMKITTTKMQAKMHLRKTRKMTLMMIPLMVGAQKYKCYKMRLRET